MSYFYIFLTMIAAIIVSNYMQGFIFAAFKAEKYEDTLAHKIAEEVKKSNQL